MEPTDIFDCQKCGKCCKGFGGTYISDKDIGRISAFVGTEITDFINQYCEKSGSRYVLKQAENGYCIFWDTICTIHPVKPRMCKAWPFIRSVLVDVSNWRAMAGSCPGMRTDISNDAIIACVEKEYRHRAASPNE